MCEIMHLSILDRMILFTKSMIHIWILMIVWLQMTNLTVKAFRNDFVQRNLSPIERSRSSNQRTIVNNNNNNNIDRNRRNGVYQTDPSFNPDDIHWPPSFNSFDDAQKYFSEFFDNDNDQLFFDYDYFNSMNQPSSFQNGNSNNNNNNNHQSFQQFPNNNYYNNNFNNNDNNNHLNNNRNNNNNNNNGHNYNQQQQQQHWNEHNHQDQKQIFQDNNSYDHNTDLNHQNNNNDDNNNNNNNNNMHDHLHHHHQQHFDDHHRPQHHHLQNQQHPRSNQFEPLEIPVISNHQIKMYDAPFQSKPKRKPTVIDLAHENVRPIVLGMDIFTRNPDLINTADMNGYNNRPIETFQSNPNYPRENRFVDGENFPMNRYNENHQNPLYQHSYQNKPEMAPLRFQNEFNQQNSNNYYPNQNHHHQQQNHQGSYFNNDYNNFIPMMENKNNFFKQIPNENNNNNNNNYNTNRYKSFSNEMFRNHPIEPIKSNNQPRIYIRKIIRPLAERMRNFIRRFPNRKPSQDSIRYNRNLYQKHTHRNRSR
ncbi:hypothetical protein SSS_07373 [Sarcoptes scabiei]|uniref:Uncharacterized protein n=1 Tax=Sarcoptes scabiei TaxID=52283 RepID=A0A834RGA0_SARSC|nr:hypothetical protein SSS_07373 [Sarcoptes scabiei]